METKNRNRGRVVIDRPTYNQEEYEQSFSKREPEPISLKASINGFWQKQCHDPTAWIKDKCLSSIPLIETLRSYRLKEYIALDILAGVSAGIMHLPMSLAFSLLASLPSFYGLYSSFWPVLIYTFFGTSPHMSIGTMAVISLMLSVVADRAVENSAIVVPSSAYDVPLTTATTLVDNITVATDNMNNYAAAEVEIRLGAVLSVSLLIGLFQIVLSVFRMGTVSSFMSKSFVSGFTTGAACHIATSQAKPLLGISSPSPSGMFRLVLTWVDLFKHIAETNIATLIIGVICLMILAFIKEYLNNNKKVRSKVKLPIPAELIVVIVTTIISYVANFNGNFNVAIVAHVPRGFPTPVAPPMTDIGSLIVDAIVIAIVSFTVCYSMASLYASKHNYKIDANQELLAIGLVHAVGAFFFSFAGAAAPPRCVVLDSSGGKTMVSGIFSCILLLFVLLLIGPLFESLPKCVLAAVVICALIPMFRQFKDLRDYWQVNKYDVATWLITWITVVVLDVSIGLVIGIAFSILSIALQSFRARGYNLAPNAKQTDLDLYASPSIYAFANEYKHVRIFRFESNLHFASVGAFKEQLFKATVNPNEIKILLKKTKPKLSKDGPAKQSQGSVESGGFVFASKSSFEMNVASPKGDKKIVQTEIKVIQDHKSIPEKNMQRNEHIETAEREMKHDKESVVDVDIDIEKASGKDIHKSEINKITTGTNFTSTADELNKDPEDVALKETSSHNSETTAHKCSHESSPGVHKTSIHDPMKRPDINREPIIEVGTTSVKLKHVIIDCSPICYIDFMGLDALKSVCVEFGDIGVRVSLAVCGESLLQTLNKTGTAFCDVYPTLQDAVASVQPT